MIDFLQSLAIFIVDQIYRLCPYPLPSNDDLSRIQIIAHRGCWGSGVRENSLAAIQAAQRLGADGVEFDVRWSADGIPVIHHDPNLQRLFGRSELVNSLSMNELEKFGIAQLSEVLQEWDQKIQLWIELKDPLTESNWKTVEPLVKNLPPAAQKKLFFMTFEPTEAAKWIPEQFPIVTISSRGLVELQNSKRFQVQTTHYALTRRSRIKALSDEGIDIGTGFVDYFPVFCRESQRGVRYVFSNHAAKLVSWRESLSQGDGLHGRA
jgi:glycerophosphoryl diester phosphodiesterase